MNLVPNDGWDLTGGQRGGRLSAAGLPDSAVERCDVSGQNQASRQVSPEPYEQFPDMTRQASLRSMQLLLMQPDQGRHSTSSAEHFGPLGFVQDWIPQMHHPSPSYGGLVGSPLPAHLMHASLVSSVLSSSEGHHQFQPQCPYSALVALYLERQAMRFADVGFSANYSDPRDGSVGRGVGGGYNNSQSRLTELQSHNVSRTTGVTRNSINMSATRSFTSTEGPGLHHHLPAILAFPEDFNRVSPQQFLLRCQIEVFTASEEDVSTHVRGRNKVIRLGQVGIRCRHCSHIPVIQRRKGSTYYPSSVHGLYQAAQNMSVSHLQNGVCGYVPIAIQEQFRLYSTTSRSASSAVQHSGAGRRYWAESAELHFGLVDTTTEGGGGRIYVSSS